MAKFMYLYRGPAAQPQDMTEEARNAEMEKWKVWMEKAGSALIDMGNPMAPGLAVVDDGSAGTPSDISGYTVVETTDIEAAAKLAKDHPFLADNAGKFQVDVFELLPM